MSEFVRGTCELYCPKEEVKLRTREHLLDYYELKLGQKNSPGIVVKAFSRSAAGVKTPKKKDMRTVGALKRTIEYLIVEVVPDERKPFNYVYDFVFDRLRSVRQEIVIQNLDTSTTVELLQPIILFLAYSSYRLSGAPISIFDPKICNQHLQECLKRVLRCYDELEEKEESQNLKSVDNRNFIEALYQLVNLGSTEALVRWSTLPKTIRNGTLGLAGRMSLEFYRGNYYRAITGMRFLPHLLYAVAYLKLPEIRRKILVTFSIAYNSKQLTVPLNWLEDLLFYFTLEELINDCTYYNISILVDKNEVRFSKQDFKQDMPPTQCKPHWAVEVKFKSVSLPILLLLKQLK